MCILPLFNIIGQVVSDNPKFYNLDYNWKAGYLCILISKKINTIIIFLGVGVKTGESGP